MASAVSRLCQRCVGLRTGYPVSVSVKQLTRGYHVSSCLPVSTSLPHNNKHTWLPHEQVPNKFVTMYRDIHGPKLLNEEAAREFVFALDHEERDRLLNELNKFAGEQSTQDTHVKPTAAQLRLVCLHQTLPFIGFGFLDNFLMIVAGEYIDVTLGATLGISTMAAAGLGNMISDVGGVGSAYYVELAVAKLGIRTPRLTPSQVDMKSTRWASSLGKVLGVAIGCILGMCPLLFFNQERDTDRDKDAKDKKSSTQPEDSTKQAVVQTAAKDGTPCPEKK